MMTLPNALENIATTSPPAKGHRHVPLAQIYPAITTYQQSVYSRKGTRNAHSSLTKRPLFLPIFYPIARPRDFCRRTGASRRTSFQRHRRRQAVGDGRRQTKSLKHPRVSSGWRRNHQRQPGEHKSDLEGRSGGDLHKATAGGCRKVPSTDPDESRHRSVTERQDRLGAQKMKHTHAIKFSVLAAGGSI